MLQRNIDINQRFYTSHNGKLENVLILFFSMPVAVATERRCTLA